MTEAMKIVSTKSAVTESCYVLAWFVSRRSYSLCMLSLSLSCSTDVDVCHRELPLPLRRMSRPPYTVLLAVGSRPSDDSTPSLVHMEVISVNKYWLSEGLV